jgi:hypothetical protein
MGTTYQTHIISIPIRLSEFMFDLTGGHIKHMYRINPEYVTQQISFDK